jgi:hypothetical protein
MSSFNTLLGFNMKRLIALVIFLLIPKIAIASNFDGLYPIFLILLLIPTIFIWFSTNNIQSNYVRYFYRSFFFALLWAPEMSGSTRVYVPFGAVLLGHEISDPNAFMSLIICTILLFILLIAFDLFKKRKPNNIPKRDGSEDL